MHSVIIACTITTLITTYIYISSSKVQLSQQLHCSVSYRWGYLNKQHKGEHTNIQCKTLKTKMDRKEISFIIKQKLHPVPCPCILTLNYLPTSSWKKVKTSLHQIKTTLYPSVSQKNKPANIS